MWKTLAVAGVSLALSMPIALAQSTPPNMSVAPAGVGNDPIGRQYPGVISCVLCTSCGSYWPYAGGYYYTVNVNYGGTYTRGNSCSTPWGWRTGRTSLCCATDTY